MSTGNYLTFDRFQLDALLLRAVHDAGYTTPTPIQAGSIPVAMTGTDLIGTAQTGTGKTAAFVLPLLQHLLQKPERRGTRALILCPTRELAEQIHDSIRMFARHTRMRSATVYGGVGMGMQERALRNGTEIIVACPGRLLDHIGQRNVDFTNVDHLVLDEADRMFDMGFLPQVKRIVALLPKERQTLLFSATMTREVEDLTHHVLRNPHRITIGLQKPAATVAQALYPVPQALKTQMLIGLLRHTNAFSMLVFTRTKHRADRLSRVLDKAGFPSAALHGDRSQGQRQRALDSFKRGDLQVLVATDIASRGLDIESVSHVINFDVPATPEDYIHRIGRTGRAERTGDAFTLITSEDREIVRDIERTLGKPIERRTLPEFDYNAIASDAPARDVPLTEGARPSIDDRPRNNENRPQSRPQSQRPFTTGSPDSRSRSPEGARPSGPRRRR
ncbi:MAG: DEAD/DEAH box helicase [Chloroflexi bacterium]|nr:DEAD/DEAH box helicase [Chloroflexota bacterium]